MSRTTATDRLERMLAVVPWIAAHDDGASITEVCNRFELTREELLSDLDVIFMVGRYPYSPDELIDVAMEGDTVWIRYAEVFRRPLRLSSAEGLALVVACNALLAADHADPTGPLASGRTKLAVLLGLEDADALDVAVAPPDAEVLRLVTEATEAGLQVEIDYYSHARDERTTRTVDPWQTWFDGGHWYLTGWCHLAEGERTFRLDRIVGVRALASAAAAAPADLEASTALDDPELPTVTIEVGPKQAWAAAAWPVRSVEEVGDRLRVTFAVSGLAWLERVLLQTGPTAVVTEVDHRLGEGDLRAAAARRALGRYRDVGGPGAER